MSNLRAARIRIFASLLLSMLVACTQNSDRSPPSAYESCKAPGVSDSIERALCSADPSDLSEALFKEPMKAFEPSHRELLRALQRIWDGDRTYGKELPWAELESARNRAVIAQYLAQAIRNREIEGSLEGLQQFAVEYVRGAKTDSEQYDGLRLLGMTDASGQVPMLRLVAQSSDGPPVRRRYAIEALGLICASEAKSALQEIEQSGLANDEARRVRDVLADRERLTQSWCRRPVDLPQEASGPLSQ